MQNPVKNRLTVLALTNLQEGRVAGRRNIVALGIDQKHRRFMIKNLTTDNKVRLDIDLGIGTFLLLFLADITDVFRRNSCQEPYRALTS